jgi:hypothetical protein
MNPWSKWAKAQSALAFLPPAKAGGYYDQLRDAEVEGYYDQLTLAEVGDYYKCNTISQEIRGWGSQLIY